jgi:hypothetical protein
MQNMTSTKVMIFLVFFFLHLWLIWYIYCFKNYFMFKNDIIARYDDSLKLLWFIFEAVIIILNFSQSVWSLISCVTRVTIFLHLVDMFFLFICSVILWCLFSLKIRHYAVAASFMSLSISSSVFHIFTIHFASHCLVRDLGSIHFLEMHLPSLFVFYILVQ